jgi:hypothetical protein
MINGNVGVKYISPFPLAIGRTFLTSETEK